MITFRPVVYPENPADRLFRRVERHVLEDRVVEHLGPVFRVATEDDRDRPDAVVVIDPDAFEPMRLVPVDASA